MKHMSNRGNHCLMDVSSGAILVAATAIVQVATTAVVSVVAAVAVFALSEKGEWAVEVGGTGRYDG